MALEGIRVIELAGSVPARFCGTILADFGASVIRVDKMEQISHEPNDYLGHGKKSIALNLRTDEGVEIFRMLCKKSDILIDSYRKGVMEKLGLGPEDMLSENKRLIYARLTGFGQEGLYSNRPGHDINFIALSGLLSMFGWESKNRPSPPLSMMAFAGGSLMCALGIMMAVVERNRSGEGQVVDCSMVAGQAYLGSWIFRGIRSVLWSNPRAENILDGGAFFYDTYETKDGKWMAVGALEPQFFSQLIEGLGLDLEKVHQLCSLDENEQNRRLLAQIFKTKSRDEWCEVFDGRDACVTPILSPQEVALHQHIAANRIFLKTENGDLSPHPAPHLSRTPAKTNFLKHNPDAGDDTEEILIDFLGYPKIDFERLRGLGTVIKSKL